MQFDVPGWVATLVGCAREELAFVREKDMSHSISVTYARNGSEFAEVDLMAMPMGDFRRATWQLFARIGERVERIQVPAQTRFVWR
jgi:hypothetical protein